MSAAGQTFLTTLCCFIVMFSADAVRYRRLDYLGAFSSMKNSLAGSAIRCGTECTNSNACHVFMFTAPQSECSQAVCVDPSRLFEEGRIPESTAAGIYIKRDIDLSIRRDLALGKNAYMSSEYDKDQYSYSPGKCVDGILVPPNKYCSICHTLTEQSPWWRVDLDKVHCILGVNILGMPDRPASQHNAAVAISKEQETLSLSENECGRQDGPLEASWTNITCSKPTAGQWVQVQLQFVGYLHFHEVEVSGYCL